MRKQVRIRRPFARSLATGVAIFAFLLGVSAQAQTPSAPSTATVSGEITLAGQPAANVVVTATTKFEFPGVPPKALARTKTDSAGRYQLRNLPAGKLVIAPQAPAFIVNNKPENETGGSEIEVSLDEDETLKNVNFALTRGGVITGRITAEDGRPVIAQNVTLSIAPTEGENGHPGIPAHIVRSESVRTDDRGIYRIFGLEPGRYLISCGRNTEAAEMEFAFGNQNSFYERIYYPAAIEAAQAGVIEVTPGSETGNVDIRLGKLLHGFRVSGHISSSTNVPVKRAFLTVSLTKDGAKVKSISYGISDENGDFNISGLQSGTYVLTAMNISVMGMEQDLIVPETKFEVADADVTGLEIKAKRGLSVSGTVMIENTSNDPLPFRASDLNIVVTVATEGRDDPNFAQASVKPDGSFTASGLQPGRVRFQLWSTVKGISFRSVERNGVVQPGAAVGGGWGGGGIVATPNAEAAEGILLDREHPVTDLTLRVVYGNCRLRGQVVQEGESIFGLGSVSLKRSDGSTYSQEVDNRGRFLFEGLAPGQYVIRSTRYGREGEAKTVTVSNGVDNVVTLTAPAVENEDDEP